MDTLALLDDTTPKRPQMRLPLRLTFQDQSSKGGTWLDEECSALIEFVLLHSVDGRKWPIHKNMLFWENAAKFVQEHVKTTYLRSGEFSLSCVKN